MFFFKRGKDNSRRIGKKRTDPLLLKNLETIFLRRLIFDRDPVY